uniref:Olfactory receptor n=1 Tax=Marmota marmota marmota TaxID=9994 RepID=A0A8C5YIG7_MARMA
MDVLHSQMEPSPELANVTRVQQFILLGWSTRLGVRDVLFAVFLALYLLTLLENTLIVSLICSHGELRKPMYFFLGNLSCLEMCYVSVTMPTLLLGLWVGPYHLSFVACMTQLFFFVSLICTECTLLASMAYDRYVAICRPLHYPLLMRPQVCCGLALSSWVGGLVVSAVKTKCIASLSYCGPNVLNQFFCDVSPLLNVSCTHVALTEAVLRMPSAAARRKAFSTCASHLVVVGIFYSVTIFIYARPSRIEAMDLNKELSVIYTVATPLCNPVIYCLRNREVQTLHQPQLARGSLLPPLLQTPLLGTAGCRGGGERGQDRQGWLCRGVWMGWHSSWGPDPGAGLGVDFALGSHQSAVLGQVPP